MEMEKLVGRQTTERVAVGLTARAQRCCHVVVVHVDVNVAEGRLRDGRAEGGGDGDVAGGGGVSEQERGVGAARRASSATTARAPAGALRGATA